MLMKFQVAKSDLLDALQTVSGSMASGEGDITSHFLFRMSPSNPTQVEVLTACQRVFSSCPVKAAVLSEGEAFTVEGWRVKKWLGVIGDTAVTIENTAGGDVRFDAGTYVQTFHSLDPQNFNLWDKTFAKAVSKGTLPAHRLASALKSGKLFASKDETNMPEAVVVDVRNGLLTAMDKRSVVVFFKVTGLEQSSLRIHTKDVPVLTGFLSSIEGDVEILENERNLFLKRAADGAVYGETRYQVDYPNLSPPSNEDQRTWTVSVDGLRRAILSNQCGASKDDNRLYLSLPDEDGPLLVSMKNENGKTTAISVPCDAVLNVADAADLPKEGFPVSCSHMLDILELVGSAAGSMITLGVNVNPAKKHRYIRVVRTLFAEEVGNAEGDQYVYVLAGMMW